MKMYKKGQEGGAAKGFGTIITWAIIIGIAIVIILITLNFTELGKTAWTKITNAFAYV